MATHEFGLLPEAPVPGRRYDDYEPEKYHCISVDDVWIEPLAEKLADVPVYWHTLDQPGKGLAYCGITLIPPGSIPAILAALDAGEEWMSLGGLLEEAKAKGRFVIHYGL